jgi:hypothetical protein
MKIITLGFGAVLVILVLYLSWIPNPAMATVHWLPRWLGHWADDFPRFRTAVPFFGLGALVGIGLLMTGRNHRDGWIAWAAMTGLVIACELGQLFMPRRVCDLNDIFWGSAGAAAGLGIVLYAASRKSRPPVTAPPSVPKEPPL